MTNQTIATIFIFVVFSLYILFQNRDKIKTFIKSRAKSLPLSSEESVEHDICKLIDIAKTLSSEEDRDYIAQEIIPNIAKEMIDEEEE